MKTIKAPGYALMNLDAIKRDVRYFDDELKETGTCIGNIAIVIELKGDGGFTYQIRCVDRSLDEIALDAYKVVVARLARDYDDNEVLESELKHLENNLEARLGRECIIEHKFMAMED